MAEESFFLSVSRWEFSRCSAFLLRGNCLTPLPVSDSLFLSKLQLVWCQLKEAGKFTPWSAWIVSNDWLTYLSTVLFTVRLSFMHLTVDWHLDVNKTVNKSNMYSFIRFYSITTVLLNCLKIRWTAIHVLLNKQYVWWWIVKTSGHRYSFHGNSARVDAGAS